ncbi:MAG: nucleoside 2-deoxyribosyltransferase [Fibromonadaceae bacterium]|jgi:hypothetical protein|nr:nucleoside 2-deoxyribosyltransferase [Fibromonadaceae bacterium]
MEIKNVFVVTPIGERDSDARVHAAKMQADVFNWLKKELGYSFETALADPGIGNLAEDIFRKIRDADVIVADTVLNNLNVFYEIGLAHALNKPVILISPEGVDVPFDIANLSRIEYNKDNFDDSQTSPSVVKELKEKLRNKFQILEKADENTLLLYLPYSRLLKETSESIVSDIHLKIKNLEELITRTKNKDVVDTEYIKGEKDAFAALTEAVKKATRSIRTTRLSPYTVVGRQNDFYNAIRNIMHTGNVYRPEYFQRIIATNNIKKLDEVLGLVTSNMGCDFTIYLSHHSYNFEIVIIDELTVFVHFCKNRKDDRCDITEIISATLKVKDCEVAIEFRDIFESIVKNSFYSINCIDINVENIAQKTAEIKEEFEKGLRRFEENTWKQGIDEKNNTTEGN